MDYHARNLCEYAQQDIIAGRYCSAIDRLQLALQRTTNRRAWSKLMLAIRELKRVAS